MMLSVFSAGTAYRSLPKATTSNNASYPNRAQEGPVNFPEDDVFGIFDPPKSRTCRSPGFSGTIVAVDLKLGHARPEFCATELAKCISLRS
jgi:hypothetical protein